MRMQLLSDSGRKLENERSTTRNPCPASFRSRITVGLSRLTVYDAVELRKPGWNSSVTAAPPTTSRRSTMHTLSFAAAR